MRDGGGLPLQPLLRVRLLRVRLPCEQAVAPALHGHPRLLATDNAPAAYNPVHALMQVPEAVVAAAKQQAAAAAEEEEEHEEQEPGGRQLEAPLAAA